MQFQFNAADVPPSQAFEPLPPDWYDASISGIVQTPTKDNATTGNWYLKVEWTLLGEKGKNRKVWTNLNLQNANPDAVRIAYEQLSAICHATGVMQMQTTEQLQGIPHQIKLSLVPAKDGYDAKNEVKGWRKPEPAGGAMGMGGAPAGFQQGGFPQTQQQSQPQQQGFPQQQAQQFPQQGAPQGQQQGQFPQQGQGQQFPQQGQQMQQGGFPQQGQQMGQQMQEQPQGQGQQMQQQAPVTGKAPWEQ